MRNTGPFCGTSRYALQINELIKSVSKNNASVLINGERGTGKKLFAESIHKNRSKNQKDFLVINCRLEPDLVNEFMENLKTKLDSESGQVTLFLESIDYLQNEQQQLFLKILKLNKEKAIKVVSSCESDLENKVNQQYFSAELYSLISSIILNFAPLRNRKEDIKFIADYYRNYFVKKSGIKLNGFTDAAIHLMEEYYWPGNVDELINAVQRAFIIGKGEVINSDDLGLNRSMNISEMINSTDLPDKSLKTAIDEFKKAYVTRILEENGWNQTKTAGILGIQRTYVIRLINELQIRNKDK